MSEPWYYRCRLTNWLMAKPWTWNYATIYRTMRCEQSYRGKLFAPAHGRLRSAWLALTFPHVHYEDG